MANHMKPFWIQEQSLGDNFFYMIVSETRGIQVLSSHHPNLIVLSIAWREIAYFTVKSRKDPQMVKIALQSGLKKQILVYNGEKELKRFLLVLHSFVQLKKSTNCALQAKYTIVRQQVAPVGRLEARNRREELHVQQEERQVEEVEEREDDQMEPPPYFSHVNEMIRNTTSSMNGPEDLVEPSQRTQSSISTELGSLSLHCSNSSIPIPPPPPPSSTPPPPPSSTLPPPTSPLPKAYDSVSLPIHTGNSRVDCLSEMRHLFSLGRLKPSLIIDPKRSYSWSQPSSNNFGPDKVLNEASIIRQSTEESIRESTLEPDQLPTLSPIVQPESSFLYIPSPPSNLYGIPNKKVQQTLSRFNRMDQVRLKSTSFMKDPSPVPLEPVLVPLPTYKFYSTHELSSPSSRDAQPGGGQQAPRTSKPGPAVPPKPMRNPTEPPREMLI